MQLKVSPAANFARRQKSARQGKYAVFLDSTAVSDVWSGEKTFAREGQGTLTVASDDALKAR